MTSIAANRRARSYGVRWAHRCVLVAFVFLAALGVAAAARATFYVAHTGSDAAAGTSPATAWRTVGRVNRACPAPGTTVLFQGSATFSDASLMPNCSGTAATPVTYGSYGTGAAHLTAGIWLKGGDHDLVFDGLDLTSATGAVVSSASSGSGVVRITVQNSVIHNTKAVGIYTQLQDSGWRVIANKIVHTGDSGIINLSPGMLVDGNTITDTGWNEPALGYATHGVYAKGPNMVIRNNDFSANAYGQAISLRMHGIRVYGNAIHDTPYALAFFNYDHQQNAGSIYVYGNRIWNVNGYVFYYDGTTDTGAVSAIAVVFDSNTALVTSGGEAVNLSEMQAASAEIASNVFAGTIGSGYRGCATCSEHHNDWYGVGSNRPAGANDLYVAPQLSTVPTLVPLTGSPVIDRGSTSARIVYTALCDQQVLHYCGPAPDQGAVESG